MLTVEAHAVAEWQRSCSHAGVHPRPVLPRQFYLITRRCTQRQFLLRPDPATNNAFLYCLIDAAIRSQIDIVLPCAMSNHYHAVITTGTSSARPWS